MRGADPSSAPGGLRRQDPAPLTRPPPGRPAPSALGGVNPNLPTWLPARGLTTPALSEAHGRPSVGFPVAMGGWPAYPFLSQAPARLSHHTPSFRSRARLMLVIPGFAGKDTCDGVTRRDFLRVGGSGRPRPHARRPASRLQARGETTSRRKAERRPRLGQGQEHHHGLPPGRAEPPRPLGPQGRTSRTTSRASSSRSTPRLPGVQFTEILPKLAQVNDKFTMIRSMSYTPNGLFNHTAAIYQMMTGYTTDKVSPSGPAGAAEPEGLPELRLATSSGSSRRPSRCCRS